MQRFKTLAIAALVVLGSTVAMADIYHVDSVCAHRTDVYNQTFRGGCPVELVVNGDGDTDLDLYVYDSNGNLIGYDEDETDLCVVEWTPRFTGNFRIEIVNRGRVYNEYEIYTM